MPTKAQRIQKELKALRQECICQHHDPILARIAYGMEQAIRYATVRTVGWPSLVQQAKADARLLHDELKSERARG